jgi:aspartokinase/homoserine dehydrogenase 1
VATAKCFRIVARIIESQLGLNRINDKGLHLGCVVSAMGGNPKTTDLLLQTVKFAATREHDQVENVLEQIQIKHEECLRDLFKGTECERLSNVIQQDLHDIRDILKTVALMKWQASRISELVSGYGELWSTQILTSLLRQRQLEHEIDNGSGSSLVSPPKSHHFVYLDARRVVTIDEEAIHDGAIVWSASQEKLQQIFNEEIAKIDQQKQTLHFVMTGYVACNTEGVATTLQRDGSDYSAAILGRLLSANSISIWTDVDGVMSADPRRVPLAQILPEVSYSEAMELAYFGSSLLLYEQCF